MIQSILPLIQFEPQFVKKPWGGSRIQEIKKSPHIISDIGESWEISGVVNHESFIVTPDFSGMNLSQLIDKYKEELLGKFVFKKYGKFFPLLIKIIEANDDLSIQVHPDDEMAKSIGFPCGKTEMWYILQTIPGASLLCGLKHPIEENAIRDSINEGRFQNDLVKWHTAEGSAFYIPAGAVHAIGKGNLLVEIQQTSDTTYRIYDYNRKGLDGKPRELHVSQGIKAMKDIPPTEIFVDYDRMADKALLVNSPYFSTTLYQHLTPVVLDMTPLDSFVILCAINGNSKVTDSAGNAVTLHFGHTLLVPASMQHVTIDLLSENAKILEVHIPH